MSQIMRKETAEDAKTLETRSLPAVQVLLATYNGAQFLQEQIDSILMQTGVHVSILARDDVSTDRTPEILQHFAERYPDRFAVLPNRGERCGAKGNFISLLEASSGEYVALADQDDVWLPEKLSLEMEAMREAERKYGLQSPILVFTDLKVVGRDLSLLEESFWAMQKIPATQTHKLPRLLAQNTFTGCTGLLNRPLVKLCYPMPQTTFMHDWWIMLVAASYGHLAPLPVKTVLYRQHGGNVVGAPDSKDAPRYGLIPKFRQHAERRRLWEVTMRNAEALLQRFGKDLPPDKLRVVEACIRCEKSPSRFVRVFTMLRYGFFCTNVRINLATLWYLWDMNAAKRLQP